MATTEADLVSEARLLLRQALRLLDDHMLVAGDTGARGPLTDLAADIAWAAAAGLRGQDTDPDVADASGQRWPSR